MTRVVDIEQLCTSVFCLNRSVWTRKPGFGGIWRGILSRKLPLSCTWIRTKTEIRLWGCHVIVVRYLIGSRTCGLIKTGTRRRFSRRPTARWPLFELRRLGMGRKSLNRSERGFPKWTSLSRSEGGGPKCPCGGDPIWPIPQRNYVIAWGPPLWTDRQTRLKTSPFRKTTYAGGNYARPVISQVYVNQILDIADCFSDIYVYLVSLFT